MMTTIASSDDPLIKESKEFGAGLQLKLELGGCVKPAPIQQLKKGLKRCHINTNTEGVRVRFRFPFLVRLQSSIFILALASGCASAPKLDRIPNGETVSIVVAVSPTAGGQTELKNDATNKDTGVGAGGGAASGAALGLTCGWFAPICIPIFATVGAIGGGVAGAVVSDGASLSDEQATQLRDRMLRLNESHDKLAELATNINDRAGRYWDLNSTEPQTIVRVGVQNLMFASTHDNQVRAILQVSVMVFKKSDQPLNAVPVVWGYEYSSPYANLDEWLDDKSDFADTSISSAIRQISSEIVSDLAISSDTGATVQFAKAQPQSSSNGTSSPFVFYGKAVEEINTNTYDKILWDKALVETGGDQTKSKARYIELRANQLYDEKYGSLPTRDSEGTQNNLSGTYVSDVTTNTHWVFNHAKHRRLKITFEQQGNKITGTNWSANLKITGVREGDEISFFTWPSDITKSEIKGNWKVSPDGSKIEGAWSHPHGDGKWNLTRVE